MAKTKTYRNMPVSAPVLAHRILNFLQEHKYEVSYSYDEKNKTWCMIQARKTGKLRTVTGNRRALNVALRTKKARECTISIGSGDWGKNTILSAAPMIAFPVFGLMNFIGSAMSSKMSESDLWLYIESIANKDFYN
jgi:hypothetical protein